MVPKAPMGKRAAPVSLLTLVLFTVLAIGLAGLIHYTVSSDGGYWGLRKSASATVQE